MVYSVRPALINFWSNPRYTDDGVVPLYAQVAKDQGVVQVVNEAFKVGRIVCCTRWCRLGASPMACHDLLAHFHIFKPRIVLSIQDHVIAGAHLYDEGVQRCTISLLLCAS